jgi:hypothetical protein
MNEVSLTINYVNNKVAFSLVNLFLLAVQQGRVEFPISLKFQNSIQANWQNISNTQQLIFCLNEGIQNI